MESTNLTKRNVPLNGSYLEEFKLIRRNFKIFFVFFIFLIIVAVCNFTILFKFISKLVSLGSDFDIIPFMIAFWSVFSTMIVLYIITSCISYVTWNRIRKFHDDALDLITDNNLKYIAKIKESPFNIHIKIEMKVRKNIKNALRDGMPLESLGNNYIVAEDENQYYDEAHEYYDDEAQEYYDGEVHEYYDDEAHDL